MTVPSSSLMSMRYFGNREDFADPDLWEVRVFRYEDHYIYVWPAQTLNEQVSNAQLVCRDLGITKDTVFFTSDMAGIYAHFYCERDAILFKLAVA